MAIESSGRQFEDPYFILGVARSDKIKEVKKAYFHKAKKYHPDLNPDDDVAKQMFLKIQAAFKAIENELDPELKARRDSSFREYETARKDGSGKTFKSRRGTKSDQDDTASKSGFNKWNK